MLASDDNFQALDQQEYSVWTNTKTMKGKRLFVVFFRKFFIQNLVDLGGLLVSTLSNISRERGRDINFDLLVDL